MPASSMRCANHKRRWKHGSFAVEDNRLESKDLGVHLLKGIPFECDAFC
jgi:hypothetical protein